MNERVYNFSPGPATLPEPVLRQAQEDLLCLPGAGASILEISHRSPAFQEILDGAEENLRKLLRIGDDYAILFLQGGSRLQFSMVPMNLLGPSDAAVATYILTGSWGKNAIKEAEKLGRTHVAWDGAKSGYDRLPDDRDLALAPQSAYLHFTSNETIQGVQFATEPEAGDAPLVCDASSDFLGRPLTIEKYGLLYACAQKNAGPAGLTVVIVRKDLLSRGRDELPGYMSYKSHAEAGSLWNTPPTFAIYFLRLVTQWLLDEIGGVQKMHEQNQAKAKLLYDAIDQSGGFYEGHALPECRSLMNVVFRLPSDQLTEQFCEEAQEHRLAELKGHRSVGGIRASIYNAMPVEGVHALRDFMIEFRNKHG